MNQKCDTYYKKPNYIRYDEDLFIETFLAWPASDEMHIPHNHYNNDGSHNFNYNYHMWPDFDMHGEGNPEFINAVPE